MTPLKELKIPLSYSSGQEAADRAKENSDSKENSDWQYVHPQIHKRELPPHAVLLLVFSQVKQADNYLRAFNSEDQNHL